MVKMKLTDDVELHDNIGGMPFKAFFEGKAIEHLNTIDPAINTLLLNTYNADERNIPFTSGTNAQVLQGALARKTMGNETR